MRTDGPGNSRETAWWRSWRIWGLLAILALLTMLGVIVAERISRVPPIPYSAFLDQLDAGNISSVSFQGNEISGQFKNPSVGPSARDTFSTRVPEIGDLTLVPELRKQHVLIDVHVTSLWSSILSRLPWPMLALLAVMGVAGLFRVLRGGGHTQGSGGTSMPAHGMIGFLLGAIARRREAATAQKQTDDQR